MRQGVARTTCAAELGKELAALQAKLMEGFFEAAVPSFRLAGDPFDRSKVYRFTPAGECITEINKQSTSLIASMLSLNSTEVLKCKPLCANATSIQAAADCVHEKMRSALRGQQATFGGNVDDTLAWLSRAQLAVFDQVLTTQQQSSFLALLRDGRRQCQWVEGIVLGELATAVAAAKTGRFQNHRHVVGSRASGEVAEVLKVFAVELEKDKRIADAKLRLGAGQPRNLLAAQALNLAAQRKSQVAQPVAVLVRVTNVGAAQEAAVVDSFKTALGPEAVLTLSVDDAINAGKKQFDVAVGVDLPEVAAQDTELGLVCVEHAVSCEFVEDVHSGLFNLVRSATMSPTPQPTKPPCPAADDFVGLTACGVTARDCVLAAAANNRTAEYCSCYEAFLSCISARPTFSMCDGFDVTKKSYQDACRARNCTSCGSTMPPAPTPPLAPCDLAAMQQRAMCTDTYPDMGSDTYRLVMAAQVGVVSAVTVRICASLRAYLVCSRRILEAAACDTTGLDVQYGGIGGRVALCRDSKGAALLKDVDCDMCTALTEPLVPGVPTSASSGSTTAVASADTNISTGHRLTVVLGLVLAVAIPFI